jgi:hypothetical protein
MTTKITVMAAGFGLVLSVLGGALAAKPALKDVAYVREGIITAGMAIEIGDICPRVSVRLIRGYSFLNSLKDHARSLGYTDAEIEDYTGDDAEEERLKVVARARLADMGAVNGQPETYCVVGRSEIANGTPLGRLLR